MSDGGILTPEQVEKSLTSPSLDERSLAETVKAACGRIAQREDCRRDGCTSKFVPGDCICCDVYHHPGNDEWRDALTALGGE